MASPSTDLSPLPVRVRPLTRLTQLFGFLVLFGASLALLVRARLGLPPWSVLDQGLSKLLGWSLGSVTIAIGVAVLLTWLPLRQRMGIGTVANVIMVGLALDATLAVLPEPDSLLSRSVLAIAGVVLNSLATAGYVGSRLGPGPRDGLMTGLHARTGRSIRLVRTVLEICVLACGWILGGTVGAGTVLFTLAIGPLTQYFLRFTAVQPKKDLHP